VLLRVYDPIRAEAFRGADVETICTTMLTAGLFHDRLLSRPLRSLQEYLETTSHEPTDRIVGEDRPGARE
jgi:hypothetical protein